MRDEIQKIVKKVSGNTIIPEISVPAHAEFGHYSTNVAMRLAPIEKKAPLQIASELAEAIKKTAPSHKTQVRCLAVKV